MEETYTTVLMDRKEEVVTVTLNRPEVHNAMNDTMIAELTAVFKGFVGKNTTRCVILRGAGKSFCAGADLNYMKSIAGYGFEENEKDSQKLAALFMAIYQCPVPTVAVVHGSAFGGANGLLAACDMVVAAEKTRFAFSEVKLGIAPATIGPFVINRIGEFGAKELMMTGKRFSSKEAEKWHLVNAVVPEEKVEEKLNEIISELMTAAPQAVRKTKKLIAKVVSSNNMQETVDYTARLIAELRASEEGQEGMTAFLQKRKANWIKSRRDDTV